MPVAIAPRRLRDDGDGDDDDRAPRRRTLTTTFIPSVTINPIDPSTFPAAAATITSDPSCCTGSNEVLIQLSTVLTITDYQRYYGTQAPTTQPFIPSYHAFADGSLIAPPYTSDLKGTYYALIYCTILTVVFFRNIIVSGGYIRRGNIKKKGLFYLLFASQLLGPVVLLPFLITPFIEHVNCTL